MSLTIKGLVTESYQTASEHGWWDSERGDGVHNVPEKLMLMVSEISEALEDYRSGRPIVEQLLRNGKPVGFPSELADVVIRVADFCGHYGIDIEAALVAKMAYNKTRPYRHGNKVC